MSTASTMQLSESHLPHKQSENFDGTETDVNDAESVTLTVHTGFSSGLRNTMGSRISRHSIKIKASSSFPNLLNLYQEPIREESNLHAIKEKKKSKKHKRRDPTKAKISYEDTVETRARQEYRKLRMDAVAREQMEKFDAYCLAMKTKVERQREERKKYNEGLQERLRAQEEVERQKLRLHRGPKHSYIHDRSYLKALPQSNYRKTILLADDLQKKGVLKNHGDIEKFWSNYGRRRTRGVDIFAPDYTNSVTMADKLETWYTLFSGTDRPTNLKLGIHMDVNYPAKWMGMKKPEIKIQSDDDIEDTTTLQLPPLKDKNKFLRKH